MSDRPDKSDLVADAMRLHGLPSFEAWAMTVDQLHDLLTEPEPEPEPADEAADGNNLVEGEVA